MGFNLLFGLRRGVLLLDCRSLFGCWCVGCWLFGLCAFWFGCFLGFVVYYGLERGCGVSRLLEVVWWITWLRVCVNSVGIRCSVYSYLLLVSLCLTGVRVFGFCGGCFVLGFGVDIIACAWWFLWVDVCGW